MSNKVLALTDDQKIIAMLEYLHRACLELESRKFLLVPEDLQKKYKDLAVAQLALPISYRKDLKQYSASLPSSRFYNWFSLVGCVRVPAKGKGAQNHLVILDNGLISDFLESRYESMAYEMRSSLVLNRIFGFPRADKNKIGKIHLHVVNKQINGINLTVPGLIKAIIRDHPYMASLNGKIVVWDPELRQSKPLYSADLAGL